jgi:hypothetical protein
MKSVRIKRIPRSFDSDIMDWHITEYLGDIVRCAYLYENVSDAMEHVEDFLIELD